MSSEIREENVLTMQDLIDDENELLEEASAVLSGSDEKNCNGLKQRQALYSCLTCAPNDVKKDPSLAVGICLACSLNCHEKHELVELYTKRNFECECGIKTGSIKCLLDQFKTIPKETNNSHNQNFAGLYCICHRPYPDPENDNEDEMIQCIICEDWYHTSHLNAKVPDAKLYSEMICGCCMDKNEFLHDYTGLLATTVTPESDADSSALLDVSSVANDSVLSDGETSSKKIKLSENVCTRPKLSEASKEKKSAKFWKGEWRKNLCTCSECLKMYARLKVEYITNLEDTAHHYEEKGKSNARPSNYDRSMEALGTLSRVNQINAITGYNRMKDKLFEFLQTFVNKNQIVTEEDIQRFFRNMKDESNNEGQQSNTPAHFCR